MDAAKCLTNKEWEQYSQQKLSKQRSVLLIKHIQSCEICADMKEGIDSLHDPSALVQTIENIHARLDAKIAKSKPKPQIIPIYFWLGAAAILILSMGVIFFPLPKSEDVAEANSLSKPNISSSDAALNPNENKKMVQPKLIKPQSRLSKKSQVIPNPVEDLVVANEIQVEAKADMEEASPMVYKSIHEPTVLEKESDSKKQRMILPSNNFSNRNMDEDKLTIFNEEVRLLDSTLYKQTLKYVTQKKYDLAIEKLLVLSKDSNFKEEAFWLLADVYDKKGDIPSKIEVLRKLVILNGRYKKEAELLLTH